MGGFIKLHRSIASNWIWQDKPFAKGQAWVDLLILANWKDAKELYRGKLVYRKAGTIACSIEWLADRWGWDRKKVMRFLDVLEGDNMISQNRTTQGTTLTVENWAIYQTDGTTQGTTNGQQEGQQTGQRRDIQEERKRKEEEGLKKAEEGNALEELRRKRDEVIERHRKDWKQ